MIQGAPVADTEPAGDLALAAGVIAVDPHGVGGVWLCGRRSRAMEHWLDSVQSLLAALGPIRRLPLSISDGRLLGGLDLAATLAQARPVPERGLLAEADEGVLVIPNAESARAMVIAAVSAALDRGQTLIERDGLHLALDARIGAIAICESEEHTAHALQERLGIILRFEGNEHLPKRLPAAETILAARTRLPAVEVPADIMEALCTAASALGAGSVRSSILATRVAKAGAALAGRDIVDTEDAALAMRMVIAPRATRLPSADEEQQDEAQPPPPVDNQQDADGKPNEPLDEKQLEEMLVAAALAALPSGVLDKLKTAKEQREAAGLGRSGARQKARLHGRRARSRRGDPRDGAPLDVLETIRAAAPWQKMRRAELAAASFNDLARAQRPIEVRRQDFRLRTFKNHKETAAIFVVDASGSSALNRLAEAKGAIELLLADCYSRRDNVALISFRGKSAELLLPPTRSLARVKKLLAALPGGGGTPLASAIDCAAQLAASVRQKGQTPAVVFLTDGKANIDRKGTGSRERGEADALDAAKAFNQAGLTALVIDTSPRPTPQSRRFAAEMAASYLPLPHANAAALSDAVRSEMNSARAG